jgi:WD40 repeat protein
MTFKQDKFGLCSMHSLNEDLLFIGCTKGIVTVLNMNERRVLLAEKLHNDDVKGIYELNSVSKDPFVVTTSFDGSAAVWKVDHSTLQRQKRYGSGDKAFHMQSSLLGHTDKILGLSVDNNTNDIVTSGADGKVLLWQANQ